MSNADLSNMNTSTDPLSAQSINSPPPAVPVAVAPQTTAKQRDEFQRLGELAYSTFVDELPQLLSEHPGKWIAYRGNRRLGIARTRTELHRQCVGQGMHVDEFLICCIEPQLEEVEMGVELAD